MRRGRNIYYRPDGRYEVRNLKGYTSDKKPIYDYVYTHSYTEAVEKKQEMEAEKKRQKLMSASQDVLTVSLTFSEASSQWLASEKDRWKHSTYASYSSCLKKYLLPYYEKTPVSQINQYAYSQFYISCQSKHGLGKASMNLIHTVFSRVMKFAAQLLPIPSLRYCKPIGAATKDGRTATTLDKTERRQLEERILTELRPDYGTGKRKEETETLMGILLTLHTGLRIGELCALRWEDICPEKQILTVKTTLQRLPAKDETSLKETELVFNAPKNGRQRQVPLPLNILSIFKLYIEQHHPTGFMLSGTERPVEPRTLTNRFKRLLKRACIRDVCFHTLRHTFATVCMEMGVEIKVVSEVLGHSDIAITIKRYMHLTLDYKISQIQDFEI